MLSDYEIDVGSMINPPGNHFCEMFPFPIGNGLGFSLYFRFIPMLNSMVGFGARQQLKMIGGSIRPVVSLVALSSMENLIKMFPAVKQHFDAPLDDTMDGTPIQCSQMIVELPIGVPLTLIVAALKNPDTIQAMVIEKPVVMQPSRPSKHTNTPQYIHTVTNTQTTTIAPGTPQTPPGNGLIKTLALSYLLLSL